MLKSILICTLLCAITVFSVQAKKEVTYAHELTVRASNSYTVANLVYLFTVTKNQSHVNIKSNFKELEPCTITLDPVKDEITGRLQAAAHWASRNIIVWGVRNSEVVEEIRKTQYTLLMIDPWVCKYQSLQLPEDVVPDEYPLILPRVLASKKSFDVFFPSQRICAPCRFSENGEKIELENQIKTNEDEFVRSFFIQPFESNKLTIAYFYVCNFDNDTAVMKLLDNNFNAVKKENLNHTVDDISANYGIHRVSRDVIHRPHIGVCYTHLTEEENLEVYCKHFDPDLKTLFKYHVPLLTDCFGNHTTLKIDSQGNSFVGIAQYPPVEHQQDKPIKLYLLRFDRVGSLIEKLHFGKIEAIYDHIELHSLIVNREYCLDVVLLDGPTELSDREVLKCISLLT